MVAPAQPRSGHRAILESSSSIASFTIPTYDQYDTDRNSTGCGCGGRHYHDIARSRCAIDPFCLFRQAQSSVGRLWGDVVVDERLQCYTSAHNWSPNIDVADYPDRFVVQAELPGVRKEDIVLDAHDSTTLSLSGQRSLPGAVRPIRRVCEQRWGSFRRLVHLPPSADATKAQASHDNGVLEITIPKLTQSQATNVTRLPIQ